ncbi:MAG: DNA cytosine methyltransferase [Pyrinomonadaceae bacterium]
MNRRFLHVQKLLPNIPIGPENPWGTDSIDFQTVDSEKWGLTSLELCAGAGGQAIGFEQAGIEHSGLVEWDKNACATLKLNRPQWNVIERDLREFDGASFVGVDIISAGLPCPPFSVAGKQLGKDDERNLFPTMLRLVDQIRPKALMVENVRGILDPIFKDYRHYISSKLKKLGYQSGWKLMNASDFGVPQLRPRVILIALRKPYAESFSWPEASQLPLKTVGEILYDLMVANGWRGAKAWKQGAGKIAPTVVGGSLKHGGPDLGPTRARRAWAELGVDGLGIMDEAPHRNFSGIPRLTVRMVARLQGFPDEWEFFGRKTQAYRQVGNAFPPPFAKAIAERIRNSLVSSSKALSMAG